MKGFGLIEWKCVYTKEAGDFDVIAYLEPAMGVGVVRVIGYGKFIGVRQRRAEVFFAGKAADVIARADAIYVEELQKGQS